MFRIELLAYRTKCEMHFPQKHTISGPKIPSLTLTWKCKNALLGNQQPIDGIICRSLWSKVQQLPEPKRPRWEGKAWSRQSIYF